MLSRAKHARRRMAFWGGLIVVCVAALQLLARALSEFSLPHVAHPCLLINAREAKLIMRCAADEPWSAYWRAVAAQARAEPPHGDWLAHAQAARAAAFLYLATGNSTYAHRAVSLLRHFPRPLYCGRLSCKQLGRAAVYWAQALDMMHDYLARHHQLAVASSATARLAQRLYYSNWRRDDPPRMGRLWRASGLVLCSLALADWQAPAELIAPRALYAEGRAELNASIRHAFGPETLADPRQLAEAFQAIVPAARAVARTAGDTLLDAPELHTAARWALVTRLPDGSRLSPHGRRAHFPSYLLAATPLYREAFAAEFAALASRAVVWADPLDALCHFRPRGSYEVVSSADAVAAGGALAMRVEAPGGVVELVVGPPDLSPAGSGEHVVASVPACLWYDSEAARCVLRVIARRVPAEGRDVLGKVRHAIARVRGSAPAVSAAAGRAGEAVAAVDWRLTSPAGGGVAIKWLLVPPAVVLMRVVTEAPRRRPAAPAFEIHLPASRWAVAELQPAATPARRSRWATPPDSGPGAFTLSLAPRNMAWTLVRREDGALYYRLQVPGRSGLWQAAFTQTGRPGPLGSDAISAQAAGLLWRLRGGEVADAVVLEGVKLIIGGQEVWRSARPQTAWWGPSSRQCVAAN